MSNLKNRVRARDNYRCTECGCTREEHYSAYGTDLEVHRLTPGSPYTEEGCVTLCKACHGPKPKSPAIPGNASHVLYMEVPAELKDRLVRLANHRYRKITAEAILAIQRYVEEEEAKEGLSDEPDED